MIHALLQYFGLMPTVPKRKPTARKKAAASPPKPQFHPEIDPAYDRPARVTWEEKEERRAAATVTTLGAALSVYARMIGQVGSRPSPQYVAAARRQLGERRWAYLQALTLGGKRVPTISDQAIGDPQKEAGLAYGLDRDIVFKLGVWEAVSALETEAFGAAKRNGKEPAEPIAIPPDIQQRLRDLKNLRARPTRSGDGRGKAGGGPDAPKVEEGTPDTTAGDAAVGETPAVTPAAEAAPKTPAEGVDPSKPTGDDEPPAGPGKP